MTFDEVRIGQRLLHRSNPLLNGFVRGKDMVGTQKPPGKIVWLWRPSSHKPGEFASRVSEAELEEYEVA